jgi:hypothetical protein
MAFLDHLGRMMAIERVAVTFGDRQADTLRRELQRGRWEGAHSFLDDVRDWDEREFYVQVLAEGAGRPAWVDAWSRGEPESAIAWLMRGVQTKNWAWEARGSGYAETVGQKGMRLFLERLARADQELLRAAELDPADPTPWAHLMWTGIGAQLGLDTIHERFEQTLRRHPLHRGAHTAMLQALCAKWYGSNKEMFAFARGVTSRLPDGHRLHVLIAIAHVEWWWRYWRENESDKGKRYFRRNEVIEEITEAARRAGLAEGGAEPRFGIEDRNYFAYCFHQMGDGRAAHAQFRRIGPWITMPWGDDRLGFVTARDQCRPWLLRVAGKSLLFGTNAIGLAILIGVFLPLGSIAAMRGEAPNAGWNLVGGLSVLFLDVIYRTWVLGGSLLDEGGPRLLHIPLGLWGILWMIVGLVQMIVNLVT